MMFAPSWLMPALRRLDPETAHNLSLQALKLGLVGSDDSPDDPRPMHPKQALLP